MERKRSFSQTDPSHSKRDGDDGLVKRKKKDLGLSIIQNMGYTGKGLGKHEQGILHPIAAVANRGRSGLGAVASAQDEQLDEKYAWTPEKEANFIALEEEIKWLCFDESRRSSSATPLTSEDLDSWISTDRDCNEDAFCDSEILHTINKCRSALDGLSEAQLMRGRSQSNPFEQIGKGIFQNRAAMKMANIDARFDQLFTGHVKPEDILYFGDICAGPGGFSEYILWRKGWRAHGFGMTLKAGTDWQLDDFITGTETFEVHYGDPQLTGVEGDIYVPENLNAFNKFITSRVEQGVHFMMADGGFSVKGNENAQEVLSKRLYLCQFICALQNVRKGGHFMCKLFDCFTPFTVGLLYLIYRCFKSVCIFKPNTSRPANSERYFICREKNENTETIRDHLFSLNKRFNSMKKGEDIASIVPFEIIKGDDQFFKYIYQSNNNLGLRQIIFLDKMKTFALNPAHPNPHYSKHDEDCLRKWNIPLEQTYRQKLKNEARELSDIGELSYLSDLIRPRTADKLFIRAPVPLTKESYDGVTKSLMLDCAPSTYKGRLLAVDDPSGHVKGRVIPLEKRGLILVINRAKVFIKETSDANSKLEKLDLLLNLPPRTLVFGEVVYEYSKNTMRKNLTVHLLDCLYLAGEDVRRKSLEDRDKLLRAFTQSIQNMHLESRQSQQSPYNDIRYRRLYDLKEIEQLVSRMKAREAKKSHKGDVVIYHEMAKERFIIPTGLLIVPVTNTSVYLKCISTSSGEYYYFNRKNGDRFYGVREEVMVDVYDLFDRQHVFWPMQLKPSRQTLDVEDNRENERFEGIYQMVDKLDETIAANERTKKALSKNEQDEHSAH